MSYQASHGDGPRFPMTNRRVTPTEAGLYVILTDILPVVAFPDNNEIGYARLRERPVTAYGGAGMVVTDYTTGTPLTGSITWPPSPGRFYVSPYLGRIYFHESAIGGSVSCTYSGMGTIVDAVDINYLRDLAVQAALPVEQVTVPANGQITVNGKIAAAVYGIVDDVYTLNPDYITTKIFDITDPVTARTMFVNSSPYERVLMVKFNKHFMEDS